MSRPLRRARGVLLRLVLHRRLAAALGALLLAPAVWLWVDDYRWENWATDGAALIAGGTGLALLIAAFGGRQGDWVE